MWLWLLPFIAYATKTQDKEETCLVLAIKAATERAKEIFEYNEKIPLGEENIKNKLIEDGYQHCMNVILSKDLRDFGYGKHKNAKLENFAHLVKVAINRYEKAGDVKVTKAFEDKRLVVAKRLAMRSVNRDL